jgi:two-component system cell cycle response regulator DivK
LDLKVIVYVEADKDNLQLVRRVLESTQKYKVIGANDGLSGLEQIEKHRPSLILTDLDLPYVNGFELLKRLQAEEHLRRIPVIAVTAAVMKGERQRSHRAGFTAFIEKPFEINEFRAIVAQSMKRISMISDGPERGGASNH